MSLLGLFAWFTFNKIVYWFKLDHLFKISFERISPVAERVSVIFFCPKFLFWFDKSDIWMGSSYVPLSKSDEKLRAEKNNTGGATAPALDLGHLNTFMGWFINLCSFHNTYKIRISRFHPPTPEFLLQIRQTICADICVKTGNNCHVISTFHYYY